MPERSYSWRMTQDDIDRLASLLYRLETLCNAVAPGCATAEASAQMLTDLRAQTGAAGAADPCPERPMSPCVADAWRMSAPAPSLASAVGSGEVRPG